MRQASRKTGSTIVIAAAFLLCILSTFAQLGSCTVMTSDDESPYFCSDINCDPDGADLTVLKHQFMLCDYLGQCNMTEKVQICCQGGSNATSVNTKPRIKAQPPPTAPPVNGGENTIHETQFCLATEIPRCLECVTFSLDFKMRYADMERRKVRAAKLLIMVRIPKNKKNEIGNAKMAGDGRDEGDRVVNSRKKIQYNDRRKPRKRPRRLRLSIYSVKRLNETGAEVKTFVTKSTIKAPHTQWHTMLIPTHTIKEALASPYKSITLHITCHNCRQVGARLVLFKKHKKSSPDIEFERVKTKKRRKNKQKARRQRLPLRHSKRDVNAADEYVITNVGKTPVLVVEFGSSPVRSKRKRSTGCSHHSRRCCKKSLWIDFKELGWDDVIISPDGYMANYCDGRCVNPRPGSGNTHSNVLLSYRGLPNVNKKDFDQCCTPTKYSSLSIIYYDQHSNIVKKDLEKMAVEECGCA